MAATLTITPKELERQAGLAFTGKSFKAFLAYDPGAALSVASTTSAWEAVELATANGYAAVTGAISSGGSYNTTQGRFEIPAITAQYTGSGVGYVFDCLVLVVDGATYPHSVTRWSSDQSLFSGQTRSYVINLLQDD
jgi:hypothetical protein